MKAILYISKALVDFGSEELNRLAIRSQIKNKKLGINGYLYYENGNFLQYIEGEDGPLMELYATIAADDRHTISNYVSEEIVIPRFPNWSMKNISELIGENYTIEQTLIQTIQLFEHNRIRIPEDTKLGLFRFMDDLARVHSITS